MLLHVKSKHYQRLNKILIFTGEQCGMEIKYVNEETFLNTWLYVTNYTIIVGIFQGLLFLGHALH